jgi:hypothetical protein
MSVSPVSSTAALRRVAAFDHVRVLLWQLLWH